MYIVFAGRLHGKGENVAKFDDLAKVEVLHDGMTLYARERTSTTPFLLAVKEMFGWEVRHGPNAGSIYSWYWTGNNTEVYAALAAIASGLHSAEECSAIASKALGEGR